MTNVFISGSMRIKKIHDDVLKRIDNMIFSEYNIIIGDADGVDASVQDFLKSRNYKNVTVYCSGNIARNNTFNWPMKHVSTEEKNKSRSFYTAKDVQMAKDCDYGLMIWDSKSTGTLSNIYELLKLGKKSLVFLNQHNVFIKITNIFELEELLTKMDNIALEKADTKIQLTNKINELKQMNLFSDIT